MKSLLAGFSFLRVFVFTLVVWMLSAGAAPLPGGTDACTLLKAVDVAPLLGGTPVNTTTPQGITCTWTGGAAGRKLLILTYKDRGIPGDAMFMGARRGAAAVENAKVSDESGIGDKAFSSQTSFGAVFVVLKQGRMLQLQYWTGAQGTDRDIAALRAVVKKAAAAF